MLSALPEESYETRDILIDRRGMWHLRGQEATPARALAQVDVVLNALHGGVGEDGAVQRILDRMGVRYAGSRPLASGLAFNKIRAREILQRAGIRMPRAVSFSLENGLNTADMAHVIFAQFAPPYMVKPPSDGAGHGIVIAKSIIELPDALGDVLDRYGAALVEEYIRGKEASVGVVEGFRNEEVYALPPAHVEHGSLYAGPEMHHEGTLRHTCPSMFTHEQKDALADAAKRAHQVLGMEHFSRSDLIVTPRTVYLLEVNAIPGLYPGSSFPVMLESVGSSVLEFLEHAIHLALARR